MASAFKVDGIDHVEVLVPDRYEAATWYARVLGLTILSEHDDWAGPGGPLMISSDGGRTMLALFEGEPLGTREPAGLRVVAFRVGGAAFQQFLRRLDDLDVFDHSGKRVTSADAIDHSKAFSVYFSDPYGNRYEVTTYDYDVVASRRGG